MVEGSLMSGLSKPLAPVTLLFLDDQCIDSEGVYCTKQLNTHDCVTNNCGCEL